MARPRCTPELSEGIHRVLKLYPQLDAGTLWSAARFEGMFLASAHTPTDAARPRVYVCRSTEEIVFFDGIPVDCTGTLKPHVADDLKSHWSILPETLDGRFIIIRATRFPPRAEVLIDQLGMAQCYCARMQGGWFVSNSLVLADAIGGVSSLDEIGLSLFFCLGWAGGDRTLRPNIQVLPGGRAAFSLSPVRRFSEPLHFELICSISPQLFAMPLDRPWRSQQPPALQFARKTLGVVWKAAGGAPSRPRDAPVPMWDREAWLDVMYSGIREVCLSNGGSSLWDLVDRREFERLTSHVTDASERRSVQEVLFSLGAVGYLELLSGN
jgi:hypothetical protein